MDCLPLRPVIWWALVYPDGRWWCEKAIPDGDLAQRTADEWNSNLPRGERDRLRVARIEIKEFP